MECRVGGAAAYCFDMVVAAHTTVAVAFVTFLVIELNRRDRSCPRRHDFDAH